MPFDKDQVVQYVQGGNGTGDGSMVDGTRGMTDGAPDSEGNVKVHRENREGGGTRISVIHKTRLRLIQAMCCPSASPPVTAHVPGGRVARRGRGRHKVGTATGHHGT